jgi:hypothetical protein
MLVSTEQKRIACLETQESKDVPQFEFCLNIYYKIADSQLLFQHHTKVHFLTFANALQAKTTYQKCTQWQLHLVYYKLLKQREDTHYETTQ